MEKFKERILNLEKNVVDLNSRVSSIQGTTISVHPSHYSVYDKEQGEISLDEFDTFRFVRVGNDIRNAQTGQTYPSFMYKLINPPKELRSHVRSIARQIWPSHNSDQFDAEFKNYSDILLSFPTTNENEFEHSDFDLYISQSLSNHQGWPGDWQEKIKKNEKICPTRSAHRIMNSSDVKKILSSKVWEFKDLICRQGTWRINGINGNLYFWEAFTQDITVNFKNTYKLLPHVSAYITPFTDANITVRIKELTKKKVVFTMSYGEDDNLDVPDKACLHWLVNGMVE